MRCVCLEPKIGAAYLIHPLRIATADNFLEYNLKNFLLPRAVRWPNLQRRLHMVSVFALEATHPARSRSFLPSEGHLSASHPTRPRTFVHRPAMTLDGFIDVFVASVDIYDCLDAVLCRTPGMFGLIHACLRMHVHTFMRHVRRERRKCATHAS